MKNLVRRKNKIQTFLLIFFLFDFFSAFEIFGEEILLKIINDNPYKDSPATMFWGDGSIYKRHVVHFSVPNLPVAGGINFVKYGAYLAVNDSFLSGLDRFTISFWFRPKENNPKGWNTNGNGGALIGSNWAGPNSGDWLIGFDSNGNLAFFLQKPVLALTVNFHEFKKNVIYHVRLEKTPSHITLFVDDKKQSSPHPYKWDENGAPLAIGANPYDRTGMGFFNGIIGGIKIVVP